MQCFTWAGLGGVGLTPRGGKFSDVGQPGEDALTISSKPFYPIGETALKDNQIDSVSVHGLP
jgi:hypothetical protein